MELSVRATEMSRSSRSSVREQDCMVYCGSSKKRQAAQLGQGVDHGACIRRVVYAYGDVHMCIMNFPDVKDMQHAIYKQC